MQDIKPKYTEEEHKKVFDKLKAYESMGDGLRALNAYEFDVWMKGIQKTIKENTTHIKEPDRFWILEE